MKIFSIPLLGLALTLFSFPVWAAGFTDEAEFPTWAEEAIELVYEADIMTGYGDGTFGPDRLLTRAEAVTLLMRIKADIDTENYNGIPRFPDVQDGAWYEDAIGVAANYGWVRGHEDGMFRPGGTLTRAEFAAMLQRAFDLEASTPDLATKYEDINENIWYTEPVSALLEEGLLRNALNLNFRPGQEVDRAEAAWTFAQMLGKPGLIGAAGEASYDAQDPLDSRRVAIKPRDFDANNQGYEIERAAIHVTAEPSQTENPVEFAMQSDWTSVGVVRFWNSFDYRADVESLRLRLRLERDDMGPEEAFMLRVEGPEILIEEKLYTNGGLALTGLNHRLEPGEELVLRIAIKPDTEESFYYTEARGKVAIVEAGGEAFKTFSSQSRDQDIRVAPVEYHDRDLADFVFDPLGE